MKRLRQYIYYITSTTMLITLLFISGCKDNDLVSNTESEKTKEAKQLIPLGMKPYKMNMASADVKVGEMKAQTAMDGNEQTKTGTRAISATAENGKVKFKFAEKESHNMILILRKGDKVAYFRNVCYKGKKDGNLFIGKQALEGFATQGMPTSIAKGEEGWYAMLVYDNPKKTTQQNGKTTYGLAYASGKEFKMKVGMMYNNGSVMSSIGYHKADNNLLAEEVEIPFVSNWTPVSITDNNNMRIGYINMKPQGVLMRMDVTNTSKFNCKIKQVYFETNMLHGNIEYNLSPDKLPNTDDKDANAKLQFTGIDGEQGGGQSSNVDDRIMMGKSFVGSIAYEKDQALNSNIDADGGKLKNHYYVWGMPKTTEELRQIKQAGNIPMTAIYVLPQVTKESRNISNIVISNEKDFNELLLKGLKPAPLLTYDLYMASRFTMRNSNKSVCNGENGGLLPVKIEIKTRAPLPIEYLCQYHAVKPKSDDRPSFATSNDIVECVKNGEIIIKPAIGKGITGDCYFSYDDITPQQPKPNANGKDVDWKKFRLKGPHGQPIPGYHIPDVNEIRGIFPTNNVSMDNADISKIKVNGVGCQGNNQWQEEIMILKEGEITAKAYYILIKNNKNNPEEHKRFLAITNGNENSNEQLVGIRGMKIKNNTQFEYSSALGIYIYSPGYNMMFVGCIPLSRSWVTRFNGNIQKFYDYVSSAEFYETFAKTKIERWISPITNYHSIISGEPRYGAMWLSQGTPGYDYKQNGAEIWGICKIPGAGDKPSRQSYNFIKCVLFSELNNSARCTNNNNLDRMYYGVNLFKDELW